MSSTQVASKVEDTFDMKFEFIVLPVADADRAKAFYAGLGWKLDMDFVRGDDFRVIQFTPPGSATSIIFGRGIPGASSGGARDLYLVVSDIDAVRAHLLACGAPAGEIFHDAGGVFHRPGTEGRVAGPAPSTGRIAPSPSSTTPTATDGFCRRSPLAARAWKRGRRNFRFGDRTCGGVAARAGGALDAGGNAG